MKNLYIVEGLKDAFWKLRENLPSDVGSDFMMSLEKHKEKVQSSEIHYMFLKEMVESITFATCENGRPDWNSLIVRWKCGVETSGHIE